MISMKEIAEICGVSVATVSKALSDKADIGAETKEYICRKADELGYLANASARALKTKQTYNIGILFEDEENSGLTHEFFNAVLDSFKAEAERSGYDITFINRNVYGRQMSYIQHCRYRNVDGVVIACVNFSDPQVLELVESEIPVVTVDHVFDTKPAVVSDNCTGMETLVRYAYSKGHRKLAYLYGDPTSVTENRKRGFIKACRELGLDMSKDVCLTESLYRNRKMCRANTELLLGAENRPTCILYSEDYSCNYALKVIQEYGLRVPEDISVIGYDDSVFAKLAFPRLATYHQNAEEIGRQAAVKLIDYINNPREFSKDVTTVPGFLVLGDSVLDLNNRKDGGERNDQK